MLNVKKSEEIVPLKLVCKELNIDPREARARLRYATGKFSTKYPNLAKTHKPKQTWEWKKDSKEHVEAKKAIAECIVPKNTKELKKK